MTVRRLLGLALLTVLAAWGASGVAVIPQDEVGVVRRFGRPLDPPWAPGLHVGLPRPLDRLDRLKPGQTRSLAVGAPGPAAAPLSRAPEPGGDDALTGDLNLVTVQALVQYRVADPVAFLFAAKDAEVALAAATRAALAEALASRGVDDVLTTGRAVLAEGLAREVQAGADRLGLGVSVRGVRLGRVAPPDAVAPAFADAARARSDRRQLVTAAEEYADRARADAAGRAREIADGAAARHDRAVALARGEADRFAQVRAAAAADPAGTRRRLYLDTIAALWPRFTRKVVVPPGQSVDVGLFTEGPAPGEIIGAGGASAP
jgi:membrane protease subunit HflK